MNDHEKINYVEFPAKDMEATKTFFARVFGWSFVDYGPDYTTFSDQGIAGGFFKSELSASTDKGSALIVFYSRELEQTRAKIEQAGGAIIKPVTRGARNLGRNYCERWVCRGVDYVNICLILGAG